MALQTEFRFVLPRGFVDKEGNLHREGTMRLATAADEIIPLRDSRVQQNPSYLTIVLLSRVITELGTLSQIDTATIENLFTADMNYLQEFYSRINELETPSIQVTCPHCNEAYEVPLDFLGERLGS